MATAARPSMRSTFSALRHRNFRLFWTGQMISLIGTWMQAIARAWLVFELTHSGLWLGLTSVASALPVLILSLFAGVLIDRLPKQKILLVTQTLNMTLSLLMAALIWTNVIQVWHVIAIAVVLGVSNAFDGPARQSFIVEMVGKEDLLNAIALNSTIFNLARVLGPALAGAILAITGAAWCFFLDGLSFIAVLAGLLMMRLPAREPVKESGTVWNNLVEGLSFIRSDETVRSLMILVGVSSLFGMNYVTLMPIIADDVLKVGESGYGVLMAAAGFGSLIGALVLATMGTSGLLKRGFLVMGGGALFTVFLALFALSPWYPLSVVFIVLTGWAMISQNATTNTVIQTRVPDKLRGRVMSVYSLLFMGIAPAGSLIAGVLSDAFSAPVSLAAGAAVCAVTVAILWFRHPRLAKIS